MTSDERSVEQVVRDILQAAIDDGLTVLRQDRHAQVQKLRVGALIGPSSVMEKYLATQDDDLREARRLRNARSGLLLAASRTNRTTAIT